jgi:hypothetical protein
VSEEQDRPPGKDELAPVAEDERFRRLEELQQQVPAAADEAAEAEGDGAHEVSGEAG